MLARSKLRKYQQQKLLEGSVATMVSDESKVLTLEAKVICSTDSSKDVRMCPGCVRREVSCISRVANLRKVFTNSLFITVPSLF